MIQQQPGWQWCTAKLNGLPCASGMGDAVSWMGQNQTSPSLSGSSAQIYIGGSTPYSNALWWKQLGSNHNATHFDYDFWVYTSNPELSQAMEFDVNQSFGGMRWVFGTECNFSGSGKWDVWDSAGNGRWVPTGLGCARMSANSWTHFVWHFEKNGGWVHYIGITINNAFYPVNVWTQAQQGYGGDGINVAVQLDGDWQQHPYSIYVDKVTLNAW